MTHVAEHRKALDELDGYVASLERQAGIGAENLSRKKFSELGGKIRDQVGLLKLANAVPEVTLGPELGRFFERVRKLGSDSFFQEQCQVTVAEADWRLLTLGNDEPIPNISTVQKFAERPYLLRDRELIYELFEIQARYYVLEGRPALAVNSLLFALDCLATKHDKYWHLAAARMLELIVSSRQPWPPETSFWGKVLLPMATRLMRMEKNKSRSKKTRDLFRLTRKGLLELWHSAQPKNFAAIHAGDLAEPAPTADPVLAKTVIVTRAMGGIGDLLTMTPGLHALCEQLGVDQIHFATLRCYFPLFEGNPDVKLIDVEREKINLAAYRQWVDLTDCPAAVVETQTLPNVQASRNDIFAQAMGVTGEHFQRMNRRPRYFLSKQDQKFRADYWSQKSLSGKFVIGIQYRSAEEYKDYQHMDELIKRLAERHAVLIFHHAPIGRDFGPNACQVTGLDIRAAFALVAGCQVVICQDSALLHLAAALDLPCVALMGPLGEVPRIKHYPKTVALSAKRELACVPCWRNNVILCKLSNSQRSICMGMIPVPEIIAVVERMTQMGVDNLDGAQKTAIS